MTRRQVWQYWCGFCGKHNLSAASIASHEKHCTKNPDRVCRMCIASGEEQLPIAELSKCIDISLPDEGLSTLRVMSGHCPACILATLLQCGAHKPGFTLMSKGAVHFCVPNMPDITFDFKAECKSWWDEQNNAKADRYDNYY